MEGAASGSAAAAVGAGGTSASDVKEKDVATNKKTTGEAANTAAADGKASGSLTRAIPRDNRAPSRGVVHVIERMGRFHRVQDHRSASSGTGLVPILDRIVCALSTFEETIRIPRARIVSKDRVPVTVAASVVVKVIDPKTVAYAINDPDKCIKMVAQIALRVSGANFLVPELKHDFAMFENAARTRVHDATRKWGVSCNRVIVQNLKVHEMNKVNRARINEKEKEKRDFSQGKFAADSDQIPATQRNNSLLAHHLLEENQRRRNITANTPRSQPAPPRPVRAPASAPAPAPAQTPTPAPAEAGANISFPRLVPENLTRRPALPAPPSLQTQPISTSPKRVRIMPHIHVHPQPLRPLPSPQPQPSYATQPVPYNMYASAPSAAASAPTPFVMPPPALSSGVRESREDMYVITSSNAEEIANVSAQDTSSSDDSQMSSPADSIDKLLAIDKAERVAAGLAQSSSSSSDDIPDDELALRERERERTRVVPAPDMEDALRERERTLMRPQEDDKETAQVAEKKEYIDKGIVTTKEVETVSDEKEPENDADQKDLDPPFDAEPFLPKMLRNMASAILPIRAESQSPDNNVSLRDARVFATSPGISVAPKKSPAVIVSVPAADIVRTSTADNASIKDPVESSIIPHPEAEDRADLAMFSSHPHVSADEDSDDSPLDYSHDAKNLHQYPAKSAIAGKLDSISLPSVTAIVASATLVEKPLSKAAAAAPELTKGEAKTAKAEALKEDDKESVPISDVTPALSDERLSMDLSDARDGDPKTTAASVKYENAGNAVREKTSETLVGTHDAEQEHRREPTPDVAQPPPSPPSPEAPAAIESDEDVDTSPRSSRRKRSRRSQEQSVPDAQVIGDLPDVDVSQSPNPIPAPPASPVLGPDAPQTSDQELQLQRREHQPTDSSPVTASSDSTADEDPSPSRASRRSKTPRSTPDLRDRENEEDADRAASAKSKRRSSKKHQQQDSPSPPHGSHSHHQDVLHPSPPVPHIELPPPVPGTSVEPLHVQKSSSSSSRKSSRKRSKMPDPSTLRLEENNDEYERDYEDAVVQDYEDKDQFEHDHRHEHEHDDHHQHDHQEEEHGEEHPQQEVDVDAEREEHKERKQRRRKSSSAEYDEEALERRRLRRERRARREAKKQQLAMFEAAVAAAAAAEAAAAGQTSDDGEHYQHYGHEEHGQEAPGEGEEGYHDEEQYEYDDQEYAEHEEMSESEAEIEHAEAENHSEFSNGVAEESPWQNWNEDDELAAEEAKRLERERRRAKRRRERDKEKEREAARAEKSERSRSSASKSKHRESRSGGSKSRSSHTHSHSLKSPHSHRENKIIEYTFPPPTRSSSSSKSKSSSRSHSSSKDPERKHRSSSSKSHRHHHKSSSRSESARHSSSRNKTESTTRSSSKSRDRDRERDPSNSSSRKERSSSKVKDESGNKVAVSAPATTSSSNKKKSSSASEKSESSKRRKSASTAIIAESEKASVSAPSMSTKSSTVTYMNTSSDLRSIYNHRLPEDPESEPEKEKKAFIPWYCEGQSATDDEGGDELRCVHVSNADGRTKCSHKVCERRRKHRRSLLRRARSVTIAPDFVWSESDFANGRRY